MQISPLPPFFLPLAIKSVLESFLTRLEVSDLAYQTHHPLSHTHTHTHHHKRRGGGGGRMRSKQDLFPFILIP